MRVLVITDLFPPIAFGGYERTCAVLVDALRERHDVIVLTSDLQREDAPGQSWVRRELRYLGPRRRADEVLADQARQLGLGFMNIDRPHIAPLPKD